MKVLYMAINLKYFKNNFQYFFCFRTRHCVGSSFSNADELKYSKAVSHARERYGTKCTFCFFFASILLTKEKQL